MQLSGGRFGGVGGGGSTGGGGTVLGVTAINPLQSSGGTNPVISIAPLADNDYVLNFLAGTASFEDLVSKLAVLFYPNLASFPAIGLTNKLYFDRATGVLFYWNGTTYKKIRVSNNVDFLDENSTISNFETGVTYYYVGSTPKVYDYDILPYPSPTPISGYNFVNISAHNVTINSDGGNATYVLLPNEILKNVLISDSGSGTWVVSPDQYIDNLYNLQQVTNKGSDTTQNITVRVEPNNYRTNYTSIGQRIQYDIGLVQVDYLYNRIQISQISTLADFTIVYPDISANPNNSSTQVLFRPTVGGTVAFLSDILSTLLTGLNVAPLGAVLSTDNILQAIGKLQGQINTLPAGLVPQGNWNASTNTPPLASSIGTQGHFYIVNVAGTTNLNGITDWNIGDWAYFANGQWYKSDNTDQVISVNGLSGVINLLTTNIAEGTNLYFTNARVLTSLLTGFVASSGTITASDTILQALQKLAGNFANSIIQNGNTFGVAVSIGSNDNFAVDFKTNNIVRYSILNNGNFNIGTIGGVNADSYDLLFNATGSASQAQTARIFLDGFGTAGNLTSQTQALTFQLSGDGGKDAALQLYNYELRLAGSNFQRITRTGILEILASNSLNLISTTGSVIFSTVNSSTPRLVINNTGQITINDLAGTGTRTVQVTASGQLVATSSPSVNSQTITVLATTANIDFNLGAFIYLDLRTSTGNVTVTFANPTNFSRYQIMVIDHATIPRTLTFPVETRSSDAGGNVWTASLPNLTTNLEFQYVTGHPIWGTAYWFSPNPNIA